MDMDMDLNLDKISQDVLVAHVSAPPGNTDTLGTVIRIQPYRSCSYIPRIPTFESSTISTGQKVQSQQENSYRPVKILASCQLWLYFKNLMSTVLFLMISSLAHL